MKTPTSHITKLTLAITKAIVMTIVFTIGVMTGVFNILLAKFTDTKDDAKTRITSDQSKIVPIKTTKDNNDRRRRGNMEWWEHPNK